MRDDNSGDCGYLLEKFGSPGMPTLLTRNTFFLARRRAAAGLARCLGALALASGPAASAADGQSWIVASDVAFAPYAYLDARTQRPAGLDTEIVSAALDAAAQPFEIRLYPWERAKRMLDGGQVDAVFQFAGTPERREHYRLVGPIRQGVTVLMARLDGPADYRTLADLAPYTIGTVHGFAYTEEFDKAALKKDSGAVNVEQLLRKLAARRVDVIVGDRHQLLYLVRQLGLGAEVRIIGKPLAEVPRFVGFRKESEDKAARFEKGLDIIRQNGTLNRILQRWERS